MSVLKTLDDCDLSGLTCLMRVDINVPVQNGIVTDKTRIERLAPGIKEITATGGRVILLSHFGRPKGRIAPKLSLAPLAPICAAAFGQNVTFIQSLDPDDRTQAVAAMQEGDIVLLENTRFHPGEESNDPVLAQQWAALGDVFIADAFSVAHRAHSSTVGMAAYVPAFAGRTMQLEIEALEAALTKPERPLVAVVGGAKISSKIDLLENLTARVDDLIIGGGMANTFLAAQGVKIGKSLCEHELTPTAMRIIEAARASNCHLHLPEDVVVAEQFGAHATHETVPVHAVGDQMMIVDVGEQTITRIKQLIDRAKTIVWNGPLGAFELPPFDHATRSAAQYAAKKTAANHLLSVAGGGDTLAALNHAGVAADFSYISTAGGAFLEWLEGKALPGVEILRR